MSAWWAGLSLEQQLYWGVAVAATVLVAVQTAMMFVGGSELVDAGDFDLEGPGDHPSGIHLLSSRTLIAFFMGFGWAGALAAAEPGARAELTALAATGVGAGFGGALFFLMRFLHTLRHSGTLDYHNALGQIGTVYLPIPASMAGAGKVQVIVQGRLKEVQALTHYARRLENRARVRVVELLDDTTLVVEPVADAGEREED